MSEFRMFGEPASHRRSQSSSGTHGGDHFKGRRLKVPGNTPERLLVQRLRARMLVLEAKADDLDPARAAGLMRAAKELGEVAKSIRLSGWDDMDEV